MTETQRLVFDTREEALEFLRGQGFELTIRNGWQRHDGHGVYWSAIVEFVNPDWKVAIWSSNE